MAARITDEQLCAVHHVIRCNSEWYYHMLDQFSDSDLTSIRKSFHRVGLLVHPDRNSHPQARDAFQKIYNARKILSNPQLRATHDASGVEPQRHRSQPGPSQQDQKQQQQTPPTPQNNASHEPEQQQKQNDVPRKIALSQERHSKRLDYLRSMPPVPMSILESLQADGSGYISQLTCYNTMRSKQVATGASSKPRVIQLIYDETIRGKTNNVSYTYYFLVDAEEKVWSMGNLWESTKRQSSFKDAEYFVPYFMLGSKRLAWWDSVAKVAGKTVTAISEI